MTADTLTIRHGLRRSIVELSVSKYKAYSVLIALALASCAGAQPLGLYCPTSGSAFEADGAWAVSNNGVVVGRLTSGLGEAPAYTWSFSGGLQTGNPPWPTTISGNGEVIAGQVLTSAGGYIWDRTHGATILPTVGYRTNSPMALSQDGSVVVGTLTPWDSLADKAMYRWTAGDGLQNLGRGEIKAMSSDAQFIAGTRDFQAVRISGNTVLPLGVLPGYFGSDAYGISENGSTVIADCDNSFGIAACRWTPGGGLQSLGDLPNSRHIRRARGVNGDGSLIVGGVETLVDTGQAFIWDETHGMRYLYQMLQQDCGIDTTGWHLLGALDISADGKYIVGNGTHYTNGVLDATAFVAVIPAQSAVGVMAGAALLGQRRKRSHWKNVALKLPC